MFKKTRGLSIIGEGNIADEVQASQRGVEGNLY